MRWALTLLVVLVLAAAWTAAIFVPDVRWFAELLTLLAVVPAAVVLAVIVARTIMKRAAADPARPPAQQSAPGERTAVRTRTRAAMAALERAVGGRSALRRLPLYLVLGPRGAGKSTLLGALGLSRIPVDPRADAAKPAPFDLWCSRDAAFVEVAESLAGERGESGAWTAFLRELRRARPRRPVEGLLAVGAATPPGGAGATEWTVALTKRLDEALEPLGLLLPVYFVFAKTDAVPGFFEFWDDLPSAGEATWGASFATDDDLALHEPRKAVDRELELLAEGLHARLVDLLARTRGDSARRVRVLRFPIEFRSLFAQVAQLVEDVCRPGAAAERFVLRGVYWTSAVRRDALESPGAASPARSTASYFVQDLLRSIVLPDRNLAAPSQLAQARRSRTEMRIGLVALGAALVVLTPALVSYVRNADLVDTVALCAAALENAPAESAPGTHGDPVEVALDTVERADRESKTFGMAGWFGPRSARALRPPLFERYTERLHGWLRARLRPALEKQLESIAAGRVLSDAPSTLDEQTPLREAYETLRLAALLSQPAGHADEPWAAAQLARAWRQILPSTDTVTLERLTEHAQNYLASLQRHPDWAWPWSHGFMVARDRMKKLDARGMPYRRVLLRAKDEPAVRASAIFSAASLEFLESRGDVQVPGAYTANGWQKIAAALHAPEPWPSSLVVERWVLDDASVPADEHALRDQVRQTYFAEYARHWMAFLDELKVKTPSDVAMAAAELGAFKQGDGFYRTLFDEFGANVVREEDRSTGADAGSTTFWSRLPWLKAENDAGARGGGGPSPVERSFRPLLVFGGEATVEKGPGAAAAAPALDKYLLILDTLKAALDKATVDAPKPLGGDAEKQFADASSGVAALLDGVEEPTRGRLWRLLMPPVKGGMTVAKAEVADSLSADWRSAVWMAWNQKLSGRFPFKSGAAPANFGDFIGFFRPDGTLWSFVHSRLAETVERDGEGRYRPKPGTDPLAAEALACLTVAQEITDGFFHDGEDPGLKFSIQADWQAPNLTGAKLWIGSKDTALARGVWAGPVRWLGEDVRLEWQQDGRPTQEFGRHAFSLFDLVEQFGGLKGVGNGGLYAFECPPLTMTLRPEGKVDALRPDFFARLRCPEELRPLDP